MADETIPDLPAATLPLTGAELLPLSQDSATVKATVNQLLALAGGGQTNGVAAAVTNSSDTVHAYTVAAANLQLGTLLDYHANYEASTSSDAEFPVYRLSLDVGATTYEFAAHTAYMLEGRNEWGTITASFQLFSSDGTDYIKGTCQVNFFSTLSDGSPYPTYSNTQMLKAEIDIGSDDVMISSFIQSGSATLTVQITSSSLALTGAQ